MSDNNKSGIVEIPDKIDEYKISKNSKIYLVCYNGRHSKAICNLLTEMGFQNVVNLGSIDEFESN